MPCRNVYEGIGPAWPPVGAVAADLRHPAGRAASPLARRPYDLRHACLSTWLNGGVYPTQVAEWAGHSVDVLLRIYAKCIEGQYELAKRRISEALLEMDGHHGKGLRL